MRYILFILLMHGMHANGQSLNGFLIDDHLVSATHSGGCNTQYLLGMPDNNCMVNLVDNSWITGSFGSAWVDRPGNDLIYENCYTTGDCSLRLILSDGSLSDEHVVQYTDFDTLANANWTWVATPSCFTQFLGGNSTRKIVVLDFEEHFALTPNDSVVGIEIVFLPGFNTDPAGVYIVSSLSTEIHEPKSGIRNRVSIFSDVLDLQDLLPGAEVMVTDHLGRCVHRSRIGGGNTMINTSSWQPGAYIIRSANGDEVKSSRVLKVDL